MLLQLVPWRHLAMLGVLAPSLASAAVLPQNFHDRVAIDGLEKPTAVEFARDGRVFIAEKSGVIKVFNTLDDQVPYVLADLSPAVMGWWDRGLLGMALHPDFPEVPYLYVLYTLDAPPGQQPPVWNDTCADPNGNGCVVSGRLSRLQVGSNNQLVGGETILINNEWCQQYPSHSVGALAFGPDGALYVSAGDGASFTFVDHGQGGNPANPCGDPPGEGGALRAQDVLTQDDALGLSGSVLRLDPMTGRALPDNPWYGGDPQDDAIVAFGLRNPFRMAVDPNSGRIWIGDVGMSTWEEINAITAPTGSTVPNFGWPCYEGGDQHPGYRNEPFCQQLYGGTAVTRPHYAYRHGDVPDQENCGGGYGAAIAGLAFYEGGNYPAAYDGALFFTDYTRKCIWAMLPGSDAVPNPDQIVTLVADASDPVDLRTGPNGDLFYVDHSPSDDNGSLRRIEYFSGNQPPTAVAAANAAYGPAPLLVQFDGASSSDPEGSSLSYAWDLDGDGAFDDSTAVAPSYTYQRAGNVVAKLRVTDAAGAVATDDVSVSVGNSPPVAEITAPGNFPWSVDDIIEFEGMASDAEEGSLSPASMTWSIVLYHCPVNDCHLHVLEQFEGVSEGWFIAPDHPYPSHLEIVLEVTDGDGLTSTSSLLLDPNAVNLRFETVPAGLDVTVASETHTAPFTTTVIANSQLSVTLDSQPLAGRMYEFASWSDGGARSHDMLAPFEDATYVATFDDVGVAYALVGAIGAKYDRLGGAATIGHPVMNEQGGLINGGVYQEFVLDGRKTTIYWTPATGAYAIKNYGAIGQEWVRGGRERGYGYPVTDETTNPDGSVYQRFSNGYIINWAAGEGVSVASAYQVVGAIGAKYNSIGGAAAIGQPVMNEQGGLINGGVYQEFVLDGRKTTIYWSPSTGARAVKNYGAIGKRWIGAGRENGYGYPLTDEVVRADGSVYQKFSNTYTIDWAPGKGVWVTR